MSETPLHPQPDLPPAPSVAEEKKPSLPTHHSPAPWELHPWTYSDLSLCFEIRDADGGVIGYLAYSEEKGITPIEWADAHLILAAPRLLQKLHELYQAYLFLSGVADLADPAYSAGAYPRELKASLAELRKDLEKAGVL